ncbi:MAG: hypothetical protein HY761_04660 [Candidatus Omnitrophica bacterium]|nr:hypothetical protein [Candidatus Omnitrophota bacterium]
MKLKGEFGFSPPLIPLVYQLLGENVEALANVQLLLSICSWMFLAYTVARSLRNFYLKPLVYFLILGLSLSHIISIWNKTILSESFTLSIFVCLTGVWFLFVQNHSYKKAVAIMIISIMFVLVRNANAYVLLMLCGVLLISSTVSRLSAHRRYYLAIAAMCFILLPISNAVSDTKNQWTGYFLNVLSTRILPDETLRTYFKNHGMPLTETLMSRSGKWSHEDNFAYYNDPELGQFREWLYAHGKSTYVRFLITHPVYLFVRPLHDLHDMFFSSRLIYYAPKGYVQTKLGKLFDYASAWGLYPVYIFLTGILVGLNLLWACSKKSPVSWVPLIMILLVYPMAVLVWHGDSHEIDRHILPVVVQARLGFVLLLLFALDAVCKKRD